WVPSVLAIIGCTLSLLWSATDGSVFVMLLISSFPFVFRWWAWYERAFLSDMLSRSERISAIQQLLVIVLIAFGVFLCGALAIFLFLGINRFFAGLAHRAKHLLAYLSVL